MPSPRQEYLRCSVTGTYSTSLKTNRLERLRPRSPAYFDRANRGVKDAYLNRWNLVVPRKLLDAAEDFASSGRPPEPMPPTHRSRFPDEE